MMSFEFIESCTVKVDDEAAAPRVCDAGCQPDVSRAVNPENARAFAGDQSAVPPIDNLRDAIGRPHCHGESHIRLPNDVQFAIGCFHRVSSFPVLFFSGSDSKTNSPFFNSTVTRLWSRISPATSLRESAVSTWRCRKRLSGRAP